MLPEIESEALHFDADAVVDKEIVEVALKDFMGKYVVLMFYPLDFSPRCAAEIIEFGVKLSEFQKLNTHVIAISTDSVFTHLAWIKTPKEYLGVGDVKITLISDKAHQISKLYGVLNEITGMAYRALFILDKNHYIRYISVGEYSVSRDVDEVLRQLKFFQTDS